MRFRHELVPWGVDREGNSFLRSMVVSRLSPRSPSWKTWSFGVGAVRYSGWIVAYNAYRALSALGSRRRQQNLCVASLLESAQPTMSKELCSPRINSRLWSAALFQDLPMMARHFTHKSICSWTFARSGPALYSPRCCHRVPATSTIGNMKSQGNRSRSSTYCASTVDPS